MRRFVKVMCAAAAVSLVPAVSSANSEVIAAYDARSAGMAYTGAAYVDNATAILHNPANLTDIQRLSINVSFNPAIQKLQAEGFSGNAATPILSTSTPFVFAPLGFVGVAYKGHSRFVIGAAAMVVDGSGVKNDNVPLSVFGDPRGAAVIGSSRGLQLAYEVRLPVAIKVTDWLSVAGGYRMTFANQISGFKAGELTVFDQKLSGHNYSSAQAGIMIKPMPELQFGLAYRSRSKVELSGSRNTASAEGFVKEAQVSNYVVPHQFTAGVATRLLAQKLLLTGDFKYWLYQDAYKSTRDHRDAMSGNIGAEYHINRNIPVRAGFFIGQSATRTTAATMFTPSPKLQLGGTIGSGAHFDVVDIDASVGYGEAGGTVRDSLLPGKYHTRLLAFAVSASIKL